MIKHFNNDIFDDVDVMKRLDEEYNINFILFKTLVQRCTISLSKMRSDYFDSLPYTMFSFPRKYIITINIEKTLDIDTNNILFDLQFSDGSPVPKHNDKPLVVFYKTKHAESENHFHIIARFYFNTNSHRHQKKDFRFKVFYISKEYKKTIDIYESDNFYLYARKR